MNVLEKILEEVEERIKKLKEVDNMCRVNAERNRNFESVKYFQSLMFATERAESIIGDIIRSHMGEAKYANIPSNDDWIPVEERLPSDEIGEVLTQNRQEYMLIGYFSYNENMGWYECESDEALLTDVVAWRPLMEPYRPKEKNNE